MSNKPIRIVIVEDLQIVADGLAALLNSEPDMRVVGHVGSVAESAAQAAELSPDVAILDFRLNDGTGADAGKAIREMRPEAKLIFLTRDDNDAAQLAAVDVGASAFIHKSKAAADLLDAVRVTAAGGTLIKPQTIASLLNKRRDLDRQRESITARENEVLHLMAEGLSSREIASRLGISYATVRSHVRSVSGKLAVHSKLQAILKAREVALID
jgi:DNA-binding NarL/FixJ family response regulator